MNKYSRSCRQYTFLSLMNVNFNLCDQNPSFFICRVYSPLEHGKRNQMKFCLQTSDSQLPIIILYKNPVTKMGKKKW